jgi:hypothetical protein
MKIRLPAMRYTKATLAIFGSGLALGFIIVVVGGSSHPRLERAASALMALGLLALPPALFADGRGVKFLAWIAARLSGRNNGKARPTSRNTPARRTAPGRPPPDRASRAAPRRSRRSRG